MSVAVLGIDPGVNGGLAVVDPGGKIAHVRPLRPDMTTKDLKGVLREAFAVLHFYDSRACYMELVGYIGGKGPKCLNCGRRRAGDGGQGAFTFGRVAGLLEMGAEMLNLDVKLVAPLFWQSAMGCPSGGDKNVTKRRAQEIWPEVAWTHNTADAALIAEHGRRRLTV